MLRDLAAKARQIADVSERPAYTDLRDGLIREGATISTALREATGLVDKAMQYLFSPIVIDAFDLWKASNGIPYELSNLQAEMERVLAQPLCANDDSEFLSRLKCTTRRIVQRQERAKPFLRVHDFLEHESKQF